MMVISSFLPSLFINSGSLLNTGVVAFKFHTGVGREVEDVFHGLAIRMSVCLPRLEFAIAFGIGGGE